MEVLFFLARLNNDQQYKREIYFELEKLASEMNYNVDVAIVEGPHDQKTLKLLGYTNPIITCSKISLSEISENIAEKFTNTVILTDFDQEGKTLNKKLIKLLEAKNVKVERFYRLRFQKLLQKAKIFTIEGIYSIKLDIF